ncbi:hypothetical protein PHMEG_00029013 [Phytophthora megakarya]|uniref:Uncharacterized protein n=1 Tax=Phytophthora megakarya TaxID=4795 RepID=A0A225V214_9STRA|nr:hypothetical protein PHMEG_00029013 [Phytophthora megakarya]
MLRFERAREERRRAGQHTLGKRVSFSRPNTGNLNSDSPLQILYKNRKSTASLEFKTVKWFEERRFLQIYVSVGLDLYSLQILITYHKNWHHVVLNSFISGNGPRRSS